MNVTTDTTNQRFWAKWKFHMPSETFWLFLATAIYFVRRFLLGFEDITWSGLQILSWVIFGLICLSYLFQLITKRFVFFSARNAVFFGIVYWILSDVLQMIPQIYLLKLDIAMQALMYVFLFVLFVQFGYLFSPSRWIKKKFLELKDGKSPNFAFVMLFLTFCLGAFPYFYYSDWSITKVWEGILSSRYEGVDVGWRREVLGDEKALILALDFFFVTFPSLVAFYLITFKKNFWQKIVLVGLTFLVWIAEFYMGTRQVFGFVVLAPVLTVYLVLPKTKRRLFSILFAVLVLILFYLMEVQVYQRGSGFLDRRQQDAPVLAQKDNEHYVTVDDNFFQLARVVYFVPQKINFVYFNELWYLLMRPIPRVFWEDKPTGFGLFFARNIVGRQDTTYSYSILGDFYVSFGVVGIILGGIFFGMLCRNMDQLIPYLGTSKVGIAAYVLCLLTLGMAVRSAQIFVFFGYYLLAFFIIAKIISMSFFRKY